MSQRRQPGSQKEFLFNSRFRIPSSRLPRWDYSSDGYYFVTICVEGRLPSMAKIIQAEVHLSPLGKIIAEEWEKTAKIRKSVELDAWVIMPDHMHGIIRIVHSNTLNTEVPYRGNEETPRSESGVETPRLESGVETPRLESGVETPRRESGVETPRLESGVETPRRGVSTTPTTAANAAWKPNSLGSIIGQFKSKTIKRIRVAGYCDFAWQTRYYDHIIRDLADLNRIRRYIQENPIQWEMERNLPF